LLLRFRY